MSGPRVLFILSRFPCYDEAFLAREIHAIAGSVESWIFSLRRPATDVVHDEARDLLPRTLTAPYLSIGVVGACAWAAASRPRRFIASLVRLVRGNLRNPEFLAKNLVLFPKAVWLARWASANGVTHVHGGWATYPASAALVVSEITGAAFSFSGHAHDIYVDTTGLAEKVRRASFVSTCTAANADHLTALAPDAAPGRVVVVHHGLRLDAFAPAPRSEDPIGILSVGTLKPHKGFEHLVDALARLRHAGGAFRGTIVGGGSLEGALRARLAAAGLTEHVAMTGALTQDAVRPHYASASIFVLMADPSWHWGIPNVIIEALAARLAVVTTRFGSVEELVRDGETGLLVPARDPGALAAALQRLAGDEPLRRRLADAGHAEVAREFDLERTAAAYARRFRGAA